MYRLTKIFCLKVKIDLTAAISSSSLLNSWFILLLFLLYELVIVTVVYVDLPITKKVILVEKT